MTKFFDWDFFEEKTQKNGKIKEFAFIAGTDEVGRGPLAGPVVSCTVMLPLKTIFNGQSDVLAVCDELKNKGVRDSKKITPLKRREILSHYHLRREDLVSGAVKELDISSCRVSYCIEEVDALTIDQINILKASLLSMERSVMRCHNEEKDAVGKTFLMVDGQFSIPGLSSQITQFPIIKGDSKSYLIALASIIAKEYRDYLMEQYHLQHPQFGWNSNMGYPTLTHKEGLKLFGPTPLHRKTFKGVLE